MIIVTKLESIDVGGIIQGLLFPSIFINFNNRKSSWQRVKRNTLEGQGKLMLSQRNFGSIDLGVMERRTRLGHRRGKTYLFFCFCF